MTISHDLTQKKPPARRQQTCPYCHRLQFGFIATGSHEEWCVYHFGYHPPDYGNCPECDIELTDCIASCDGLCRECYSKKRTKIKPFPHDDFDYPIAKGIEQRRRIWLIGIGTKTVEGFVDIVSQVDVGQCFRYAFAPDNDKNQFSDYEWNGIEIFDPKKRTGLDRLTCHDQYIFTHWDSMATWICSILNRCEYRWSISTKDFMGDLAGEQ